MSKTMRGAQHRKAPPQRKREVYEAAPAYGRTYKTAEAIRWDWSAGKDFLIRDHLTGRTTYCNNADAPPHAVLRISYDHGTALVNT